LSEAGFEKVFWPKKKRGDEASMGTWPPKWWIRIELGGSHRKELNSSWTLGAQERAEEKLLGFWLFDGFGTLKVFHLGDQLVWFSNFSDIWTEQCEGKLFMKTRKKRLIPIVRSTHIILVNIPNIYPSRLLLEPQFSEDHMKFGDISIYIYILF
jgi:hypothetical protein